MFLEIGDLKKSFGSGDNEVEVLKGISFSVEKARYVFYLDLQALVNQHY